LFAGTSRYFAQELFQERFAWVKPASSRMSNARSIVKLRIVPKHAFLVEGHATR
jgi:hypothetical protein